VVTTADAPEREAAWLSKTGDGLPTLLAANGGPWQVIQARQPRTVASRQSSIFVLRSELDDDREANQRIMPHYDFVLKLNWPAQAADGSAEEAQLAFDQAIELLLTRIRGFPGDKSHASAAGVFTSVGENPRRVIVRWDDPEQTLLKAVLTAKVLYSADELEING
jgi:hypothetical protein